VPAARADAAPKTVILGFDGMDFTLTQRFMDEGVMPNFARLAERGMFQELQTSNPAQSPVSWAVFNTGSNPGKTGVAGFVSRDFSTPRAGDPGTPRPKMMLGFAEKVPVADFVQFPMAAENRLMFVMLAALGGLMAGIVLFKLLLRMNGVFPILLALAVGGGGWWLSTDYADGLPADGELPYVVNPMQGTNFWTYLDEAGIRMRGIAVPSTYPPDDEGPNTELLSGLGVMDIGGSPGTYSIYTNDTWKFGDSKTNAGGRIYKLFEDEPGLLQAELVGPRNWIEEIDLQLPIDALKEQLAETGLSADRVADLEARLKTANSARRSWTNDSNDKVKVPFTMQLDTEAHAVTFTVQGNTFRVEQGGWSDLMPVEFVLNEQFSAYGVANYHVILCDEEETRVLVTPINVDPLSPPVQMPISAPYGFAAELQEQIGHAYETLGWACLTNPLKDIDESRFPYQSFIDDMVITEGLREELLMAGLDRPDEWDLYFQVLSTTDRIGHMLFREFDVDHPNHDAEIAATMVSAWDREFPLSEAVREVYMNEDRLMGRVLERLDSGALGDDPLLIVVSDHGFTSFRRQVNLNNVLAETGWLALKDDRTIADLASSGMGSYLQFVDWERTKAYSLGLGEVFVNLAGREPQGIVQSSEYDAVVEGVRADLLRLTDPQTGVSVVTTASRRDELYSGPWWKEGTATRKIRGEPVTVEHFGFGDIFLGYAPTYRVAWANTLGNLDLAAITDNKNTWSGDHVSVDPSHVPGVLFSNRAFDTPTIAGLIDIGPTMLTRYGIDPAAPNTDMDGSPLPFANLTR
jgi:predicted AlkP superfamily phosphohydrolase/phosphomutase